MVSVVGKAESRMTALSVGPACHRELARFNAAHR
jgi:hypothetical protein